MKIYQLALFVATLTVGICDDSSLYAPADWTGWGGNIHNNRWATRNKQISSTTINELSPHCNIPGAVSATPVTLGNAVYFPTWTGFFVALDYSDCKILWQLNVTDLITQYAPLTPVQAAATFLVSRTSPQIDGNTLYFGTQTHALIIAVDVSTGKVLGKTQLNSHPLAVVTQSPTLYKSTIFVGTASLEEAAVLFPGYACCSFVGNIAALTFDRSSGFTTVWNIPMIPAAEAAMGWSGASIWGSQPSIDESRGQVFVATGNVYTVPQVILDCRAAGANITAVTDGLVGDPCLPRNIWQESVLAIDIQLGIVNWVQQLPALDSWTLACGIPGLVAPVPSECPGIPGPDSDFGMAPTYVPASTNTPYGKDVVVVGQKTGNLFAMSAQAGQIFWVTAASPGSPEGGLSWGVAVDDSRVYFTAINFLEKSFTLEPSGLPANSSAYGAASLKDGSILWEVASPRQGVAFGPPTVVGDLVLVGRTGAWPGAGNGSLLALQQASGTLVKELAVTGVLHGGVAVEGGSVLFGTGYSRALTDGSLNVWSLSD